MKSFLCILFYSFFLYSSRITGPIHHKEDSDKRPKAHSGRFLYAGEVPRFKSRDIELTASKLGLTLRVQAWVTKDLVDSYYSQLFNRWKNINDALRDKRLSVYLSHYKNILKNEEMYGVDKVWLKVAQNYMKNVYDDFTLKNISNKNQEDLKLKLSLEIKKFLLTEENENKNKAKISEELFYHHMGKTFTATNEREGYIGYITLVYPMAGGEEGPTHFPFEKFTTIKFPTSNDARWWSDKWGESFGGFPFLLLHDQIGFHGPIDRKSRLNTWFLQRGYVSHSCLRLDGNDIIEILQLYPEDFKSIGNYSAKVTILDNFDVIDWDLDGKKEVINLDYYSLPYNISQASVENFSVKKQRKLFWINHPYAQNFFDETDMTMNNIPQYDLTGRKPVIIGSYNKAPLSFFSPRKNRIIQYFEEGVKKIQNDGHYNDNLGDYPPRYFRKY